MDKFISDLHFGHENIIKFERTRFKTIEAHDSFLRELIASSVNSEDTLYILGDIGELTEQTIAFWRSLPCKKILIKGNHDKNTSLLSEIFEEVHNKPLFYTKKVVLSHEPIPVTHGLLNVHGHLHGAKLKTKNHLNISIDVFNYQILTSKRLSKIVGDTLPGYSENFLFEWYADFYEFTKPSDSILLDENGEMDLFKMRVMQLSKQPKITKLLEHFSKRVKSKLGDNFKDDLDDYITKRFIDGFSQGKMTSIEKVVKEIKEKSNAFR